MEPHISFTYDDYANMPDDGNRYEIEEGVLHMMSPSPGTKHQEILVCLTSLFLKTCTQSGKFFFAPLDVIFSPTNVRQPDFVFISNKRLDIVTSRGIEGAPDLVVEILSPSTAKYDKANKRKTYEQFGVSEYWIVDPAYELVEQFLLSEGKYELHQTYGAGETITSPHIPCLSLPVAELFPV